MGYKITQWQTIARYSYCLHIPVTVKSEGSGQQ